MCQIKSGIVLKDSIFCPLDYDEHEKMIKELKLNDTTTKPNFVRVEITPKDNNIFNHNLDNWQLKIDQDLRPEWFNEKLAEEGMKKELQEWFEERFVLDTRDKIDMGRWFLGGSAQVKNICGSAQVENIKSRAICCFTAQTAEYKSIQDNGIAILYYKDNPEIIVANPKIKLIKRKVE